MRVVAFAPNHLGDGVMALPAMTALAACAGPGALVIHAPRWGAELYRDVPAQVLERRVADPADVAVLFGPSWRQAFRARRARRRVGHAGEPGRRLLLTDVVPEGTHRADGYRALAEAVGSQVIGGPTWRVRPSDGTVGAATEGAPPHVGLNPVSPSGVTVQWRGYRELADRLVDQHGIPVVFYGGPGEEAAVAAVAGERHPVRAGLSLAAFGAALSACRAFVSNDSGAAHFARAVGARTVVVYGSTVPERTGPDGAIAVLGPRVPCAPCYRKTCSVGLGCLDVPVDRVLAAVLDEGSRS